MTKTKPPMKVITKFLVFTFFFLAVHNNYSQGPNAPEAAAFEPVDATDVVNLVTGDLAYTLPLLTISSPEGGYPLALSYHAGIAMEQEASWVGLGWSLNPGAINRNVNGFPDDWKNVKTYEYYWNKGGEASQHTLNVTIPLPNGVSVGLGASWGSLRGFSGSVSIGVGIQKVMDGGLKKNVGKLSMTMSSDGGASIGLDIDNYNFDIGMSRGKFSAGMGVGTRGLFNAGMGLKYIGGEGIIGYASLNGLGTSLLTVYAGGTSSAGIGGAYFSTILQQDDMTIKNSGYTIPLVVVNYRYEKVKWFVDKLKQPGVSGPLYTDGIELNVPQDLIDYCESHYNGKCRGSHLQTSNPLVCQCINDEGVGHGFTGYQQNPDYAFSDILDVKTTNQYRFSILDNNPIMHNYDGFNVSGQGVAGRMSPKILKSIPLVNVNQDFEEEDLLYFRPGNNYDITEPIRFHFDNELSSGALVNPVSFNNPTNPTDFDSYINYPSSDYTGNKYNGNYVEYFTYENIPANTLIPSNYIKPDFVDEHTIAGFKITSVDGMTYYYMQPVYSVFEKMRDVNYQDLDAGNERDKYYEKTNSAYATHWLLTAVVGPDFIDNGDRKPGDGDMGYWVNFEYGKWSEGMVWRNPGKVDEYTRLQGQRRYSWGLKELYYLDKINTRTHTALFIKDIRQDAKGVAQPFIYKNTTGDYTMPSQVPLKLNKIITYRNDAVNPLNIQKTNAVNLISGPNTSYTFYDPKLNKSYTFMHNLQNNIFDVNDPFLSTLESSYALEVINFNYNYELAPNSPNTDVNGKLALKEVNFRGKQGVGTLPPYKFSYSDNPGWNFYDINYWGYNAGDAGAWSLTEIQNPIGGKIKIEYEGDQYRFENYGLDYSFRNRNVFAHSGGLSFTADIGNYDLQVGDTFRAICNVMKDECTGGSTYTRTVASYDGLVRIAQPGVADKIFSTFYAIEVLEPSKYNHSVTSYSGTCPGTDISGVTFLAQNASSYKHKNHAGVRVKSISVSDNSSNWKATYEYSLGSVPYEPYFDFEGVPYQSLLRSPNVLYDKVTVKSFDKGGTLNDEVRTEYEFFTDNTSFENTSAKIINNTNGVGGLNSFNGNHTSYRDIQIEDYQNIIGNLKSKTVYRDSIILSKTENNYKTLDISSGFVTTESAQMYKSIDKGYGEYNELNSTTYTKYPVIIENTTTTQGGNSITTYFDKHDEHSGTLLETRSYLSDGTGFKTEVIPAYKRYPSMGSKVLDPNNKNMISQETASYTHLKDGIQWKITGVGINTWKNWGNNVWRKHKTYTWNGSIDANGFLLDYTKSTTNDDGFNWSDPNISQPAPWKLTSEIITYNAYSKILEARDINTNPASIKLDSKNEKIFSTANATYGAMFYSGAEDELINGQFGGNVSKGTGATISSPSHTGKKSLRIDPGDEAFKVVTDFTSIKDNNFKISVWVNGNFENIRLQVGTQTFSYSQEEVVHAGDWSLLNFYPGQLSSGTTLYLKTLSGTVWLDDFRVHPVSSSMISYVYNKWDELECIINGNNMATKFEYDLLGRLIKTSIETPDTPTVPNGGFKEIQNNEYHYRYQN